MVRHSDDLHRRALIVNGLGGGKVAMPATAGAEFRLPELMREGGVTGVNLTVTVDHGFAETLRRISYLLRAVDASGGAIRVARTADDLRAAKADGVPAVILGFQSPEPIEGELEHLDVFHRLGVRIVQLTYQRRNLAADGCGEAANAGLSVFGRDLVAELNRLGILIDLSHTGVTSTLEAIERSSAPVSFTHACVRARNPLPRNKTDEEIRALAARGGVMGINAVARLISPEGKERGATMAEFVDQVDHVVELVGVDHVGIGLDISEGMTPDDFAVRKQTFLARYPELGGEFAFEHYYTTGLDSMARTGAITDALVERGYSDEDVLKILGGNFVRLFDEVWRAG
jgi:membrane dipeptidase